MELGEERRVGAMSRWSLRKETFMKSAASLAGIVIALAACVGQAGLAMAAAAPTTRPAWLPEDYAKRLEAANSQRKGGLEFLKLAYVGQYWECGDRSPDWDTKAVEALEAWATGFVVEVSGRDTDSVLWYSGQEALQAGCKDPLVTNAVVRNKVFWGGDQKELRDLQLRASRGMKDSGYHGVHRICCLLRGAQYLGNPEYEPTPAEKEEAKLFVELARAQVGDAVNEEGLPRQELLNILDVAGSTSLTLTGDRWKLAEGLYQAMEQQPIDRSSLLTAKGRLFLDYADDGGWDGTIGDGKTTPRERRQEMAGKLLEEAWHLDQGNAWAALWRMRLAISRQAGEEEVLGWFRRTLEADPDLLNAYMEMKDYRRLESDQAALQFGRECAHWLGDGSEGRLVIVDLHLRMAWQLRPAGNATGEVYFQGDPQIWQDVSAAYEPFIKARALSQHHSLRYARIAMWCGQWERARELLKPIKEFRGHREMSEADYNEMRKRVDDHFRAQ